MRKAGTIILLFFAGFPVLLAAQAGNDDPWGNPDWDQYYDDFSRGDQTFIISLGTIFPAFFRNDGESIEHKFSPPVGGTGSLAYNYYFNSNIFIGGEAGGMFLPTLGGNTLYVIPLGFRAGYQFNYWKFEFPVTAVAGVTWYRYLSMGNFGFYFKAGAAGFYRVSPNWSFGANTDWYFFPQWTGDKSENVQGNMIDFTLSARYHF